MANVFSQDLDAKKSSCTPSAVFPDGYRAYRVLSSLILNVGTQMLYAVVFFKIRKLSHQQITQDSRDKMQQANTTVSIIFGTSLLFMVLPSIWNVYSFFSGSVQLGPIMGLFPCLNGAVNVFIYDWKHKDFKAAIKALFTRSTNQVRQNADPKPLILQGVLPPLKGVVPPQDQRKTTA